MARIAIVGTGIAGLACAHFLRGHLPGATLTLLQRSERSGGKLAPPVWQGYRGGGAATGVATTATDTRDLAAELGLEGAQLAAPETARRPYLYVDGGLRPLPLGPASWLRSELLSPPAKLRAIAEPLLGRRRAGEESVHGFVARHFGHEAARVIAGPLLLGAAAGDARQLSLDALFPQLRALENAHGSLLWELLFRAGEPSYRLGDLSDDAGVLIEALTRSFAAELHLGAGVAALQRTGQTVQLTLAGGERVDCDAVVLATPASVSSELLRAIAPQAASELTAIPYVGVRVLELGFERIDVPHPLDGLGFLAPRGQGVRALAVWWRSALPPERSRAGRVLLRVVAGGAVDPDFMALSDDDALEQVRHDLRIAMGITVEPAFVEQIVWNRGVPQYLLGHRERVARARAALPPGTFLVGDAYDGLGLDDRVRAARRVAGEIAARWRDG